MGIKDFASKADQHPGERSRYTEQAEDQLPFIFQTFLEGTFALHYPSWALKEPWNAWLYNGLQHLAFMVTHKLSAESKVKLSRSRVEVDPQQIAGEIHGVINHRGCRGYGDGCRNLCTH